MNLPVGQRVRVKERVEKYPHFIVEVGQQGTVTERERGRVIVTMDDKIPGAEEWDNAVHFDEFWPPEDYLEAVS